MRSTAITVAILAAAAGGAGASPPAAAAKVAAPPSARQIARAVGHAESSAALWATVNICNSQRDRNVVGVRGQMPTLGFGAALTMTVALDAFNPLAQRFEAVASPNAVNHVALGTHATGLQQGGAEFPFHAGTTGLWRATVTFAWSRDGRVLARATRQTAGGHRDADFGSPAHYTAATCRIG